MTATSAFTLAPRLRAGETVYSAWCNMSSPLGAEIMVREGFSALVIDQQHGLWDLEDTAMAIAAVQAAGAAPIVRPPQNDLGTASRALDFGAQGVIAAMINSAADARAFVAATKYPPLGERSWGPARALMLSGFDAATNLAQANTLTVTFAMIETRQALERVDEIVRTDGVDALFVGPSDLSIALSNGKALNHQSPDMEKALDRIADAASKAGKIAGAFCADAPRAMALAKRGYRFLTVGGDIGFLRAGAAAQMKILNGG